MHAACEIEAYWDQRQTALRDDGALLVLSFDGKGIVMRPEALRAETVRAAAAARQKLAPRLSPGEKNGRRRMAEIGVVYDAVPAPRTPADIMQLAG